MVSAFSDTASWGIFLLAACAYFVLLILAAKFEYNRKVIFRHYHLLL